MTIRAIKELPASALAFVPLLMLPALAGAFWAVLFTDRLEGTALLICATVVLGWYLLGGAIALRHLGAALSRRRELKALTLDVGASKVPAFVVSSDGYVQDQNTLALERLGDLTGRRAHEVIARAHVLPDGFWRNVLLSLDRTGSTVVNLGGAGRFEVSRAPGADLQLWRELCVDEPQAQIALTNGQEPNLDDLPVALMLLNGSATVCRSNAAAQELLGEELEGKPLSTLLEGPGRALGDWVSDACAGRLNTGPEVLRVRGAGPEHFVQVALKRSGEDSVMAVLSDASDLKKLEAQFVQSQKMQAIGQLAGGIAHDFNNLLTAISGHCDLLMLRHDKGDPDYADLDQISQNANRAAALVGQLLAYSRKQTLKLQMLDLRDSLSDLTHLLNRLVGERIVLTFHHDPRLHMIRADKRQLEQVIMNLVVNARDAMPDGGDITITTGNVHFETGNQRDRAMLPPGDYVCVEVQDQGSGIPADVAEKMFEPFFSTKRVGEGTGLGLSTAYGIVKQTGGYIFCDTAVGEGSLFSLYFPAHIGQVAEVDHAPAPQPTPSGARTQTREPTVLLVEDEAPVRAFASRALQLQGCKVIEAACAEDALELLSDQRLVVDVFVTDVVMPGMDGPAWVRTALRDRPATRVIFMSGYTEDIFMEGRTPVHGAVFLAKPFSLSDLTALVSRQLEAREGISGQG